MPSTHEILIEPGRGLKNYWQDLWSYRDLFYFLAWRDVLVRYKQTVIGVSWSVIRPVLTMVVFTIIFGKIAHLPSNGAPYPILVFSALLPWQFFSNAISETSNSLVNNSNMLSKIYFPRLIVPASAIMVSVMDFIISLGVLIILMAWYHFLPSPRILLLPFFFLFTLLSIFGLGVLLAALNVRYRDFRLIVPFLVQFGLYVSPVAFSSSIIPEQWKLLYSLNPMVGAIDGFRWAILGGSNLIYLPGFFVSLITSLMLLVFGIWYFRKTEQTLADII